MIDTCPICDSEILHGSIVKRDDRWKKKLQCGCGHSWERELTNDEKEAFNG